MRVNGGASFGSTTLGRLSSCSLDRQGQVWCWGNRAFGLLGKPWARTDGTRLFELLPARTDFRDVFGELVVGGTSSMCGRAENSEEGPQVLCWGHNLGCDLGLDPAALQHSERPVRIGNLPDGWVKLEKGAEFGCVLDAPGQVWCWGLQSRSSAPQPRGFPHFGSGAPAGICNPDVERVRSYE